MDLRVDTARKSEAASAQCLNLRICAQVPITNKISNASVFVAIALEIVSPGMNIISPVGTMKMCTRHLGSSSYTSLI